MTPATASPARAAEPFPRLPSTGSRMRSRATHSSIRPRFARRGCSVGTSNEVPEGASGSLSFGRRGAVRRLRLAQKMTFLIEGTSGLAEPSEGELRQFYEAHHQEFRRQARVSFTQVFF